MRTCFFFCLVWALACGDDSAPMDGGADGMSPDGAIFGDGGTDTGGDAATDAAVVDAAPEDAGSVDAGVDAPSDASVADGGAAPGFGMIAGPCGRLRMELGSAEPSFYSTRLDFMDDAYDEPEERPLLHRDTVRLLETPNAGGSSEISEAFALETLVRCEGARLVATEAEIEYDPMESAKTDFLVAIDGRNIGVSVVRAFTFPLGSDYTVMRAQEVIGDKLDGVLESSMNVTEEYAWDKQILAVMAPDTMPLESVMAAWESFGDARRADTIVYVIVTDGEDEGVYLNR